jgi:hypothetical protein
VKISDFLAGISDHDLKRKRELAEQLVRLETDYPGSIRLRANPSRLPLALDLLSQLGFKKPLFTSKEQFVIDCFLSHIPACDLLLTYCALVGPKDPQDRLQLWNGRGDYKGSLRILPHFQYGDPLFFVINIAPVFLSAIDSERFFCDLLEPNRTVKKEMQDKLEAEVRDAFAKNPPPKI